ncbi:TMV resistance protein N-like isoform X2 [Apium graveolens]|uniref:TMV resistance protein N-like isoform X2 n=1 Tax=Apium graveolens TaxID=4045 RepID=UPI003D7A2035
MFQIIFSCIAQLWELLCESLSSPPTSQTPSSSPDSLPSSNISETPASTVLNSLASTSSQTPSSSDSYSTRWDVFLSFRGSDTRNKFTSHLYDKLDGNGIQTFRDDPELRSGEVISDALLDAIRKSKTYIVVLSENYASSSWCLDELAEILLCYKTMQRLVIPVFYNINPAVVRYQTGKFQQAFQKHHVRFGREKVNNWRLTLTEVASFSGYHISENRSEADVINEIIDELLLKINPKTLDVAKYPVGLDSRVTAITTLLRCDKEGVIRVGIHGMGGVGKTTLAKAVYNKHYGSFHGSCFLADVREASTRENGLVSLQQKLIDNVLKRKNVKIDNVDQGIELIRARICSKKVLIVIDDLDNIMPLEFIVGPFAMGSIIIITTRNEDLLDSVRVEAKYKVNGLGDVESRQLFMQHAFGDNKIPDTFKELSKEILEHAGGLPLALKVFGSNLLNQSERDWRWFINKLKRIPIGDVENKLKISYHALKSVDPMLQNVYLDIACFFVGLKKKEVVNIMETCYTFVDRHIHILNKRCLLTTNDDDELGMHDLLQDMGRNIARNESPDEPGKHSRLWVSKDICDVLKKKKGTEAIECIIPRDKNQDVLRGLSFTTKTFKKMSKLRFLYFSKVSPVFGKLKTLNMSYSQDLTTTPDFTKFPCLETLNLNGCESLEEVHMSVGSLMGLNFLYMHGCKKLRSLPDTICNLRALIVLDCSECSSLKALPIKLGNIESLTKLIANDLSVSYLPDSIGYLPKLVDLELRYNKNLRILPFAFGRLSNLKELDISFCDHLHLVRKLPPNLKRIDASNCKYLQRLPNLSNLKHLEELTLVYDSGLTDVPGLEDLISIRKLDLRGCAGLTKDLTKLFFKVYSEYGHQISVYVTGYLDQKSRPQWSDWILESPTAESSESQDQKSRPRWYDWILESPYWTSESLETPSRASEYSESVYAELLPNESHNFMGIILCFNDPIQSCVGFNYSVKNTTSGFMRSYSSDVPGYEGFDWLMMVIVPKSIFSITDDDNTIELTVDKRVNLVGIHLLYNT